MIAEPPTQLSGPVEMLRAYISNESNTKPLIAVGRSGHGRGHWIDASLTSSGIHPIWVDEPVIVPSLNGDDEPQMPVYDLHRPEYPPVDRSIVLIDAEAKIPEVFKGCMVVVFPEPPEFVLRAFLEARDAPGDLVQGNPDYWSVVQAIRAWSAAKVPIQAVPTEHRSWSEYSRGTGRPPVDGMLFAYQLGQTLPVTNWWWNRTLWMKTKITGEIHRLLLAEVRMAFRAACPGNNPVFPWILTIKKRGDLTAAQQPEPERPLKATVVTERPARSYAIDW